MKKVLVLACILALGTAVSVFATNPSQIANDNPVGGDILVADNCDAGALWVQEPEDCDGSWALVTSDTDLGNGTGYFVYDDYEVNGPIQAVTVWYGDLQYNMGWSECVEDPMPVLVEFRVDDGSGTRPDTTGAAACSYNINLNPVFLCQLSGVYDVYRADFTLPTECNLLQGWMGVQGVGNGDTCVLMWYNSTTGNGVNSYQCNNGITDYEQAFCLYGEIPEFGLTCDLTIVTPFVPSIGGNILFDLTVTNTGSLLFPTVIGEIFPTIGDCPTGTEFDFNLTKTLVANLAPGATFTGYYFYAVVDVSGLGLSGVAINADVGDGSTVYGECCDEFWFFNPWGRASGEIAWGDEWMEREIGNVPVTTSLGQNYPNPFNATTSIPFTLAETGHVNVTVYNLAGQVVETIVDGYMNAGTHTAVWEASTVSSGVYFYTLETDNYSTTKKMNLLK